MWLIESLKGLPPELIVLITSATPVIEVRGAVPLGILLGLPPLKTALFCIAGSILPVFPLLWILGFLSKEGLQHKLTSRFLTWLFERTRRKSKIIEEMETLGLLIFIAIPFPGTGVWTGCIAAHLLGLSWLNTFIAALLGTAIATIIMTMAALGIIRFF